MLTDHQVGQQAHHNECADDVDQQECVKSDGLPFHVHGPAFGVPKVPVA